MPPQAPRNRPQMTKPTALKTNHAPCRDTLASEVPQSTPKHFTQKDGAKKKSPPAL